VFVHNAIFTVSMDELLNCSFLQYNINRIQLLVESFDSSEHCNLVDPASSHMLFSKIKPCTSEYKLLYGETANSSVKQL
jgi:hypothetical protein